MKYPLITFGIILLLAGSGLLYYAHMPTKPEDLKAHILASSPGNGTSVPQTPTSTLFNENKPAPELIGITKWLNTDRPLTLQELRGKVVLIDFWTNQCINCIRTLPYVTKWYDTYHDQGFTVIGVHTPELAYEYTVKSIEAAIKQYNIHYPVAQDNNYKTWNAYSNEYWPGFYLIDKNGIIRRTHFGEGEYDETEQAIKQLLSEANK
jgi:thiol-disulfide isomerase/thioredoxin